MLLLLAVFYTTTRCYKYPHLRKTLIVTESDDDNRLLGNIKINMKEMINKNEYEYI